MAAALQSTAPQTGGNAGPGDTLTATVSVTVDAGSDRYMAILVGGEGDGTATQAQVSSAARDGQSATLVRRDERTDWSWTEIWALDDPNTGTSNLVVTVNEADQFNVCVLVAQGATGLRTGNGTTGSSTSSSVTVASVGSDDLVFDVVDCDGTGHNPVPGADQTEQMERDSVAGGTETAASTQPGSAGGVMSWSWTTSCPFSHTACAFIGTSAGGAPAPRLLGTLGAGT